MAKIIETRFISSCECCGRTEYELEPFSKLGDSEITEKFGDALLVKSPRPLCPPDKEVNRIWKKFFGRCRTNTDFEKSRAKLVQKYGQERVSEIDFIAQASGHFEKVWQCKDCAILSDEEYYEKLGARKAREKERGERRAFLLILDPDEWKIITESPKKDCSDFLPF